MKTYTLKDGSFTGKVNSYIQGKDEVTLIDEHFNVRHVKTSDIKNFDEKEVKDAAPKDVDATVVKKEAEAPKKQTPTKK